MVWARQGAAHIAYRAAPVGWVTWYLRPGDLPFQHKSPILVDYPAQLAYVARMQQCRRDRQVQTDFRGSAPPWRASESAW